MPSLIAETLDAWREAERLLDRLPPTSPDHETVAHLVVTLRERYARLVDAADTTHRTVAGSQDTIDAARAVLELVRLRHPTSGGGVLGS